MKQTSQIPEWPIQDKEYFIQWCISRRIMGETWMKIADTVNIARSTLYEYMDKFPDVRTKIDAEVDKGQIEALRQTGMELALKNKDRQLLMFMLRAKAKMYDTRSQAEEIQVSKEELFTSMTPEEALAKLQERKRVQKTP